MQLVALTPSRDKIPLEVTEALRQRRIALGISQRDLALRIPSGILPGEPLSQSSLSSWERGMTSPNPAYLAAWAAALGVQVVMGLREIPKGEA